MAYKGTTPFESIENAQEYLGLLGDELVRVRSDVDADCVSISGSRVTRRLEALRLVSYKLQRLQQHVQASGRLLNDLRMLGRVLGCEARASLPLAAPPVRAEDDTAELGI